MAHMDTSSKLSGETIIVHHIPLVHCQIPGRQCCGPVKHPNPFCPPDNLGLTRTTSLPERDILHQEALVYSSLIQTSSSGSSTESAGRTGDLGSNSCEASPQPPVSCRSRYKGNPLRRNPFLLHADEDEEEDDAYGDEDGDNLNGYLEDSSFHLHGNSDGTAPGISSFRLHDVECSPDPIQSSALVEGLVLSKLGREQRHGSSSSPLSMDCGEQDWAEDEDEKDEDLHMINGQGSLACSCCSSPDVDLPPTHRYCYNLSKLLPESQLAYSQDSSCQSWEGPFVNFSAIYDNTSNVAPAKPLNLNMATTQSVSSSSSDSGGAFYLDLHASPTESRHDRNSCKPHADINALYCCKASQALDANCNTYPICLSSSETADLSSCAQSPVRLGGATQNYYKLVTCDLSSQSSPSPAGSSATSCSEGQGSPNQPTEYFLFRQPAGEMETEEEEEEKEEDMLRHQISVMTSEAEMEEMNCGQGDPETSVSLEGQLYVNVSPLIGSHRQCGAEAAGRPRSRSYDRCLDASPSLERMLSCPMRLSEGSPHCPPRVTSFAEIARSKKRGAVNNRDISSSRSHSALEFPPVLELKQSAKEHGLQSQLLTRCYSQGSCYAATLFHPHSQLDALPSAESCEPHTSAEVGSSPSSDGSPSVVRYGKDKRPNTLPIQPFMFQHQVGKSQSQFLRPLLSEYLSQMQNRARGKLTVQGAEEPMEGPPRRQVMAPGSVRPSPLGSYSPVRQHEIPSLETCSTCSLNPECDLGSSNAPHSLSFPGTADPLPLLATPWCSLQLSQAQGQSLVEGRPPATTVSPPLKNTSSSPLLPVASVSRIQRTSPATIPNPLEPTPSYGSSQRMKASVADCSGPTLSKSQPLKLLPHQHSESLPDYVSERPPDEFCLSPDGTSESLSIDLLQKKDLVKALNMAVDFIVTYFGTSRDAGVKAKLGNSSVSPNIGHLILKYLCPAIRDVLQDGLRGYVLDLIIGQRRNVPWSVVESSAQLGPSTRVIHGLFSKVSQYSELTNHSMRLNAFIFGLLNLQSLEFWFNHLFTHEDIIAMHYHPWGFLPLSQGICQPLVQELLLLLQPLSLLPFELDLLFEPQLRQKGQDHIRHKEQLCSTGLGLEWSARSTFQLMKGWGKAGVETKREKTEARREEQGVEKEVMELNQKGPSLNIGGIEQKKYGTEQQRGRNFETQKEGMESGIIKPVREGGWRLAQNETDYLNKCCGDRRAEEGKALRKVKGFEVEARSELPAEGQKDKKMNVDRQRDRQAGWWYQLMQSSQVYIENSTEGSKFVKWEKRKKRSGTGEAESGHEQSQHPPREGVVEGAEASNRDLSSESSCRVNDIHGKGRPFGAGNIPESGLNEHRKTTEKEPPPQACMTVAPGGGQESMMWWSRLFGSGARNPAPTDKEDQGLIKSQKNRLPSGWLSLDKSVLDFVAQAVGVGKRPDAAVPPQGPGLTAAQQCSNAVTETSQQPAPWKVRALCHHLATEPGHLSFKKGDLLQVLSRADPDWLRCVLGNSVGLVPIIYVTLTEDSQESR
ncbi:AP-4 complex accessory subunit RUSC2-like isoform X2 [Brienomyrus brachyistius]|uniref:AP-4 complex accessory subunit RUSC2-like isoform X2 n=1 Tax=Brienomyrus brachyistius TaxID=42636 RepID=UPI0020B37AFF|nr:AP-4 complex accessory subunit RUSC2-like isoform X2 [Brienomyrus brachyistius]